jgi:hypothetical protein
MELNNNFLNPTKTHLLRKMNKYKPLTKRRKYQKVQPYDSKIQIILQLYFGFLRPCLAKNNFGLVYYEAFSHIYLVQAMITSLITI